MKNTIKLALSLSLFALLFSACSATKSVVNGGATRSRFVGTWTITNVSYDGIVQNAVQNIFDQAPPAEFVGSTWQLTNSGNGLYTLPNGTSQTIFWSLNDNNQTFQFKKLYEGDKARKVEQGYQLSVAANDGSTMTLKIPISVGNGTAFVVYTFMKK